MLLGSPPPILTSLISYGTVNCRADLSHVSSSPHNLYICLCHLALRVIWLGKAVCFLSIWVYINVRTHEYGRNFMDEGPHLLSLAPLWVSPCTWGRMDMWRSADMSPPPLGLGDSDGWSVFRKEVYVCAGLSVGSCFLSSFWS